MGPPGRQVPSKWRETRGVSPVNDVNWPLHQTSRKPPRTKSRVRRGFMRCHCFAVVVLALNTEGVPSPVRSRPFGRRRVGFGGNPSDGGVCQHMESTKVFTIGQPPFGRDRRCARNTRAAASQTISALRNHSPFPPESYSLEWCGRSFLTPECLL